MIELIFPDGNKRSYEKGITAIDVAKSISEGLARNVLSALFNNNIIETVTEIHESGTIQFFTWNDL